MTTVYLNPEIDRSHWGVGPWDDEPDKISWTDGETDLPCLLVRSPMGCWCGYVGVEPGHPLHGVGYYDIEGISVHGGLTFTGSCQNVGPVGARVCHVPGPGKSDDVWWTGFDGGHYHDLMPVLVPMWQQLGSGPGMHYSYRTAEYMRAECERLARQLKEWSP